jgi:pimeloyl-ACP methyl ester carboxylesterase
MPSHTLKSGVEFFFTDSGAIANIDYTTLVIIHGHTFHSGKALAFFFFKVATHFFALGIFQRLNPLAQPNSLRIISVNRRCYPGSSGYSAEELAVFNEGTDAERASLLEQQGRDLALFVDGLITELSLPRKGGIALIGWSMGTIFLLSLIASVGTLPADTRDRLASFVHTVVLLRSLSLLFILFCA